MNESNAARDKTKTCSGWSVAAAHRSQDLGSNNDHLVNELTPRHVNIWKLSRLEPKYNLFWLEQSWYKRPSLLDPIYLIASTEVRQ
jgi:hypothetical protein